MSAPDFETLYQIEDAVEAAVRAVLEPEGISTLIQRDDAIAATPYVEVQFVLGAGTQHFKEIEGVKRNDGWNGQLRTRLITERTADAAKPSEQKHRHLRSLIRKLLYAHPFNRDNLPYYVIPNGMLYEVSNSPAVQVGDDLDVSDMLWNMPVYVRPDAWPAS